MSRAAATCTVPVTPDHTPYIELFSQFDLIPLSIMFHGKAPTVVTSHCKQMCVLCSVKVLDMAEEDKSLSYTEGLVLQMQLDHPRVAKVLRVECTPKVTLVVLEYMAEDMLGFNVRNWGVLHPQQAVKWCSQLVKGLLYFHDNGVCLRDAKMEGILLDRNGELKYSDFTMAERFEKGELTVDVKGSKLYMAPEIHRGDPYCPFAADIWSVGCIMYGLLFGGLPFKGRNALNKIQQFRYCKTPIAPIWIWEMFGRVFQPSNTRISAQELAAIPQWESFLRSSEEDCFAFEAPISCGKYLLIRPTTFVNSTAEDSEGAQ